MTTCPVCGTGTGVLVWMVSKIRTHLCPVSGARLYWKGSLLSTDPAALMASSHGALDETG